VDVFLFTRFLTRVFDRYKMHGGVLYSDRDHEEPPGGLPFSEYRYPFVPSLLMAAWLYPDLGDFEFVIDFGDTPHLCDLPYYPLPFLKYAALDASKIDEDPQLMSSSLLDMLVRRRLATTDEPAFARGFTVPSPDAWSQLSLSREQLQHMVRCNNERFPWADKKDVVFWRGSATGRSALFPTDRLNHSKGQDPGRKTYLQNKRTFMTLTSYPYR
jgi:hypothetical protein